jgi:hypothetical protein
MTAYICSSPYTSEIKKRKNKAMLCDEHHTNEKGVKQFIHPFFILHIMLYSYCVPIRRTSQRLKSGQ